MANVIFYAPHQDDDVLSFGPAIVQHVAAGDNVITVLVTDGSKSAVRAKLNGGSNCSWHGKIHNPETENYGGERWSQDETGQTHLIYGEPLTEAHFSSARNLEYVSCMLDLNVSKICIGENVVNEVRQGYDYSAPYVDGTMTVAKARTLILKFEAKYPGAQHKAQTWLDPHSDHAAVGQALRELFNEGKVADARFFVKPSFVTEFKATSGIATFGSSILTDVQKADLFSAAAQYKYWSPAEGRYAVGEHSVSSSFEMLLANPRCTIHRP